MARTGREKSILNIYHVILRGNDSLFLNSSDHEEFLNIAKKYFDGDEKKLYAYSLESNKIHLVFYAEEMSLVMKPLCTSYARFINRTYNKTGKLFYDRYKSVPINDNEMLYEVIRFVNTKPNAFTSIDEYRTKKNACSVDDIKKDITVEKITDKTLTIPCEDSYSDMTDKEVYDYLLYINDMTEEDIKALDKKAKKEIVENALKYSNLSRSRLSRLFAISAVNNNDNKNIEKKKTVKKVQKVQKKDEVIVKKEEEKKPESKKKELSVWLL